MNPWYLVTLAGQPELWVGITAGIILFYLAFRTSLRSHRRHLKLFLDLYLVSFLLTFIVVVALKFGLQVPRPCTMADNPYCESDYSFPSGHAALIFTFFTSLFLFTRRRWLVLTAFPIAVALSRVALGVHTVPDIIAGSAIGIAIPLFVWRVFQRWGWKK